MLPNLQNFLCKADSKCMRSSPVALQKRITISWETCFPLRNSASVCNSSQWVRQTWDISSEISYPKLPSVHKWCCSPLGLILIPLHTLYPIASCLWAAFRWIFSWTLSFALSSPDTIFWTLDLVNPHHVRIEKFLLYWTQYTENTRTVKSPVPLFFLID
jgi:hypothetical protein